MPVEHGVTSADTIQWWCWLGRWLLSSVLSQPQHRHSARFIHYGLVCEWRQQVHTAILSYK